MQIDKVRLDYTPLACSNPDVLEKYLNYNLLGEGKLAKSFDMREILLEGMKPLYPSMVYVFSQDEGQVEKVAAYDQCKPNYDGLF